MVWTKRHDALLCREILVIELYRLRTGTREKGQTWDKIFKKLNCIEGIRFVVDQRCVQERC